MVSDDTCIGIGFQEMGQEVIWGIECFFTSSYKAIQVLIYYLEGLRRRLTGSPQKPRPRADILYEGQYRLP
jgi:hypothetical protein